MCLWTESSNRKTGSLSAGTQKRICFVKYGEGIAFSGLHFIDSPPLCYRLFKVPQCGEIVSASKSEEKFCKNGPKCGGYSAQEKFTGLIVRRKERKGLGKKGNLFGSFHSFSDFRAVHWLCVF